MEVITTKYMNVVFYNLPHHILVLEKSKKPVPDLSCMPKRIGKTYCLEQVLEIMLLIAYGIGLSVNETIDP